MAKQPKRPPTANRPKPTTPRLTGSAALIAALQATINDPVMKGLLSCVAPAAVELFLVCYGYAVRRFLEHLEDRERLSAIRRIERNQTTKLRLAEEKLNAALGDPYLSEAEKIKLRIGFADGKAVLAQKAILNAFDIYTPSAESANSAQQVQGGSIG